MSRRYDAVLFDLLTALLDSWTLWDDVAGGEAAGRRWRHAYLRHTYGAGTYQPYESLLAKAAADVSYQTASPMTALASLRGRGATEAIPCTERQIASLRPQ